MIRTIYADPTECEQCQRTFVPLKGSAGRFCTRACAGAHKSAHTVRVTDGETADEPGGILSRGRRYAARLIAAGLCISCRTPHDRGTNRCAECTKKAISGNLRSKHEARKSKLCVECKEPWPSETKTCTECRAKHQARRVRKSTVTFCNKCGRPRDGTQRACSSCLEKMRVKSTKRRATFAAEGRCVQCGGPKTGPGLYCDEHIFQAAARRWLGNSKRWHELATLLDEQGGRCAYTGELLILGGNASVDHKTPRSRGGTNTIENVHWVTWDANRTKREMTHHEFVAFCQLVAERHANPS